MTGKIVEDLRFALGYCGYNLDEIMTSRRRTRIYADLRAIVWSIYQSERSCSSGQVGRAFGWDRATIYCALRRNRQLLRVDKEYVSLYDMIYGYYQQAEAARREAVTS